MRSLFSSALTGLLLLFLSSEGMGAPSYGVSELTPAQSKQIEDIARSIAAQHNENAAAFLDDMTISSKASASGRTVRIDNTLRVQRDVPPNKLREFAEATKEKVIPRACYVNRNNPAFDRGLSYTFAYRSIYGQHLTEFTVDKRRCELIR